MIAIRAEAPGDAAAIRRVLEAAFERPEEADVVDDLRAVCDGYLAFVAVEREAVVGHALFTPVTIDGAAVVGMGLGPLAVAPAHQRLGIGARLVRHGLERLRATPCPFVVVLGHPSYYPRFGFAPAARHGLRSQWPGIPAEAFMLLAFEAAALPAAGGVARYRREFDRAA